MAQILRMRIPNVNYLSVTVFVNFVRVRACTYLHLGEGVLC